MRSIAAFAALLLLAGCASDDASTDTSTEETRTYTGMDGSVTTTVVSDENATEGPATARQVLGSVEGLGAAPAEYPFDVTVPSGGAVSVAWEIVLDAPAANDQMARIDGPGCSVPGPISISVGGGMTYSGTCDDLDEGTTSFTLVMITGGSPSVSATITGTVALPA